MSTGRNDPCPCGSGRKYKHCCLEKDRAASHLRLIKPDRSGVDDAVAQEVTPPPDTPWEVDLVPIPTFVRGEPNARLTAALIVADGLVLYSKVITDPPAEPEGVSELLARGIAAVVEATGVLPSAIRVRHWSIAEHFNSAMLPRAVQVYTDLLLELDHAAAGLVLHLTGASVDRPVTLSQPETWSAWGLPDQTIAALFHSAAVCYRAQPWRVLQDIEILLAECPTEMDWTVCILGAAGVEFGIAFYEDEADLSSVFESVDPMNAIGAASGMVLSLSFQRSNDLPPRMRKEIRTNGWEVAGPEAYPALFTLNTAGGGFPPAHADEVISILHALAAYVEALGEAAADYEGDWHHEGTGVRLTLIPWADAGPVAEPPEVLMSAVAVGSGAAPEMAIEVHDAEEIQRRHAPLVEAFEKTLREAGISEATARRHAGNADLLIIYLADHMNIPLSAMTEYDLRIFLHDWCIAKVRGPRTDRRAIPVSLKRFLRFVGQREDILFPWAEPVLADREAFEDRLDSFPGGLFLDSGVQEWQAQVTLALALQEFLPEDEMANGEMWGDLMGEVEWQLQRELQRRWLLWREEVIASGVVVPEEVRPKLIERQRTWETTPHPSHKGMTPIKAVMRERKETASVL